MAENDHEPDEPLITPAMLDAGVEACFQFVGETVGSPDVVRAVFVAMYRAQMRTAISGPMQPPTGTEPGDLLVYVGPSPPPGFKPI